MQGNIDGSCTLEDLSEHDLTWLIGQSLREVHSDDFGRWSFTFTQHGVVTADCPWRLVSTNSVVISSCDHGQQYGLAVPIDAAAELLERLRDCTVGAVSISEGTADLIVKFTDGQHLEIIPFSTGYEAWETVSPTGIRLIAQGGGQLTEFPSPGVG
jgi:hypothetical protein